MSTNKHIIIGAGPAGIIAAETLRKFDAGSTITVIGNEPEPPYSRMAIPYYLADNIEEAGTHLRKNPNHFGNKRIEIVKDEVTEVNEKQNSVSLQSGNDLNYDKLLIATGSHAVVLPIPGANSSHVCSCWTLEDARKIISIAKPNSNVVLVGAGFIGCIILEALAKRKVNLSVIELENRMVPRMMNETSGGFIKHWCEQKGIKVYTSTSVEEIDANNVQLDNKQSLAADLVIMATGIKANVGFLNNTSIKVDSGILVNEYLQTSDVDIFAAGDVAQGKDFSTNNFSVHAIQPTAADHGRIAANNMAGKKTRHQGSIIMNVLDTVGLISSSFGLWMGAEGGDYIELQDPSQHRYLNLQFKDDVLVGASSVGLTEHVGVVRGLIQSKIKLGKWKSRLKADPTRLMEAYLGCTQAVGHNAGIL